MVKKNIPRLLFQFVFILLALEILLRIVFYQRAGKETFAVVAAFKRVESKLKKLAPVRPAIDYSLQRPDSSAAVNERISMEVRESNYFEYSPWIEYKNIDFSGRYINTKGLIRASDPDKFISAHSLDTVSIYFFGGSTMYGFNSTDQETIASAFVKFYRLKYPRGRSIHVVNYGICGYYSYNELMLFSHLIYTGKKPHLAIFLDGLNEFLIIKAAENRLPYFYYRLKMGSQSTVDERQFARIVDSTQSLFKIPTGILSPGIVDKLAQNYLENMNSVKRLASAHDVNTFFFVQPNPYFNYPNRSRDPKCDKEENELIKIGYPLLEKEFAGLDNCWFLGNLLQNETGYPFIDRLHYSPAMSAKIAAEILEVIGNKINEN